MILTVHLIRNPCTLPRNTSYPELRMRMRGNFTQFSSQLEPGAEFLRCFAFHVVKRRKMTADQEQLTYSLVSF